MNILQWILLVIISLPVVLAVLAFPVRAVAMRFMSPVNAQMLFFIFAPPLIALREMWQDLMSLPKRWRKRQAQRQFYRFFGFSPDWTLETQNRVHDKLFERAAGIWQNMTLNDGQYASLAADEKQIMIQAMSIAEWFGYAVFTPQEYLTVAARNGRPRPRNSE